MAEPRPLFIPVILGTVRKGRRSALAAEAVLERVRARAGVDTELIDVGALGLATDDEGQAIKTPAFSEKMARADALILVCPEYNRGYPGSLKHALDSCLEEYIHKAVGVVGVSAGTFGGTRVIENLLPVLRELGLVTIFWDVNITHSYKAFDPEGKLIDAAFGPRIDKFLSELVWMATTMRYGREHVALEKT
jgi:NAD(P)H-dependent FMN reductase